MSLSTLLARWRNTNGAQHLIQVTAAGDPAAPKSGTLASTLVLASGNTPLGDIECLGNAKMFVRIDNGNQALDAFSILGSADGINFETLYDATGDFTTPAGLLLGASGDLTGLALSTAGWFILDCSPFKAIQVTASAGTDQTVGTVCQYSAR